MRGPGARTGTTSGPGSAARARAARSSTRDVELEAGRALDVPAAARRSGAARPASRRARRRPARARRGPGAGTARRPASTVHGGADRVEHARRARPWRRRSPPAAAPARARTRAAPRRRAATARCGLLVGQGVVALARAVEVDGADLEQPHVGPPARLVAAHARPAASRAASCAASPAPPTSGCAARTTSSPGSRSRARQVGRGEAVADRLAQPVADERVLDAAARALRRAPAARSRRGGWAA